MHIGLERVKNGFNIITTPNFHYEFKTFIFEISITPFISNITQYQKYNQLYIDNITKIKYLIISFSFHKSFLCEKWFSSYGKYLNQPITYLILSTIDVTWTPRSESKILISSLHKRYYIVNYNISYFYNKYLYIKRMYYRQVLIQFFFDLSVNIFSIYLYTTESSLKDVISQWIYLCNNNGVY